MKNRYKRNSEHQQNYIDNQSLERQWPMELKEHSPILYQTKDNQNKTVPKKY